MSGSEDRLLSASEVADRLGWSADSVHRRVGHIAYGPATPRSRLRRWDLAEVMVELRQPGSQPARPHSPKPPRPRGDRHSHSGRALSAEERRRRREAFPAD